MHDYECKYHELHFVEIWGQYDDVITPKTEPQRQKTSFYWFSIDILHPGSIISYLMLIFYCFDFFDKKTLDFMTSYASWTPKIEMGVIFVFVRRCPCDPSTETIWQVIFDQKVHILAYDVITLKRVKIAFSRTFWYFTLDFLAHSSQLF